MQPQKINIKGRLRSMRGEDGFSLVEVLVAVIILAIIAIPLMRGFVVTQRLNNKAQRLESAQTVAQNVMEALKSVSLAEMAEQFNSTQSDGFTLVTADSGGTLTYFQPDTAGGDFLRKEYPGGSSHAVSVNAKGQFVGQPDNQYQFAIKGIYEDAKYYDVLIRVDASHYRGTETADARDGASAAYNSVPYSYVASYSQQKDYMFLQTLSDEQEVYQQIRVSLSDPSLTDDMIGKNIQRTITTDITGTNPVLVNTTVTYHYLLHEGVDQTRVYAAGTYIQPDDGETFLRNVFLCYTPDYYSTDANNSAKGGIFLDNIVINNNGCIPVNLCLVKQKTDTNEKIDVKEQNYRVKVTINEKNTVRNGDTVSEYTKIRTNLNTNIAQTDSESAVKSSYPYQTRYVYSAKNITASGNADAIQKYLTIQSLDGASAGANIIYDTSISVYDSGAYANGFSASEKPLLKVSADK
ncbi:MAG: prepilin-type N-terminal cleavage/methylation domain-containing protein [Butyrivibrio sp.]|nr:prepilin-type N-terminal cleavage/methylation domain-containing protein [Butyrivibrio sp.]